MNTAILFRDIPKVSPEGTINSISHLSIPQAINDAAVKLDALEDLYMVEMESTPDRAAILRQAIQGIVSDVASHLFELSRMADAQMNTRLW